MGSVNISFLGVCTIFQDLPSLVPPNAPINPNFPLAPNRVVLVKKTVDIPHVDPHIAKIQFVADQFTVQGPALPPAPPPGGPNVFALEGVSLSIANASNVPPLTFSLQCLPSLKEQLKHPADFGLPAPLVYFPDPAGAAAWFDVSAGSSWNAYLMSPLPPCDKVPSISILNIPTDGPPQLLVKRWDESEPTIVTLTSDSSTPDINVMNFADGKGVVDDNDDFMLNYLATTILPRESSVNIPKKNVCLTESPLRYSIDGRCGDAGPGCSNSNYP